MRPVTLLEVVAHQTANFSSWLNEKYPRFLAGGFRRQFEAETVETFLYYELSDGLTEEEVAQELGQNKTTVYNRIKRVRDAIKEL